MFFHVVSLSNSSLEPRLRRNSMVTCECRSVNRKLESTISGISFFSGTRLVFVDLLCVCFLVSLMQVWSRWKTSCACKGSVVIFLRSDSCVIAFLFVYR